MARNKTKDYKVREGKLIPEESPQAVTIPDECIYYIMSRYLHGKNKEGEAPVVIGIPTHVVEDVLQLFIDWAEKNGYVRDGILTIGGHKIG